jgi:hypothetical protein
VLSNRKLETVTEIGWVECTQSYSNREQELKVISPHKLADHGMNRVDKGVQLSIHIQSAITELNGRAEQS